MFFVSVLRFDDESCLFLDLTNKCFISFVVFFVVVSSWTNDDFGFFARSLRVAAAFIIDVDSIHSQGMRVYIDFSFTLLNREHFSANETFSGRQIKFTFDSPAQGNRRYIPVDDLYERNFTDANGEFQLELTISSPRTLYETELRLPLSPALYRDAQQQQQQQPPHHSPSPTHSSNSSHGHGHQNHQQSAVTGGNATLHHHGGSSHHGSHHHQSHGHNHHQQLPKTTKLETTYFSFGGFDWNVSVIVEPYSVTAATSAAGLTLNLANNLGLADRGDSSPMSMQRIRETTQLGDHALGNGSLSLRLRRLTGVDHRSRSRYFLSVGEGERRLSSGLMDDISDAEGAGSVWSPRMRIQDMAPKGTLRLTVELVSANTISETTVNLPMVNHQGAAVSPSLAIAIGSSGVASSSSTCYDRDKQAWAFEADTHPENGTSIDSFFNF